jgi:GR25 family glycosyltransferase involved in LPS biosynthesis
MNIKSKQTYSAARFPIKAYLINLDNREDRMFTSLDEANKCGIDLERISATKVSDLASEEIKNSLLTEGALACLRSHQKAWQLISEGGEAYGMILEDDFYINNAKKLLKVCKPENLKGIDILQVGYLRMNFRYWTDIQLQNIESKVFILLAKYAQKFDLKISNKLRVKRHRNLALFQIADDFRAGAHAYIVSKQTALRLLEIYKSDFITVDGYLCALSWTRSFRVIRIAEPLVTQRKSESSIRNWGSEGNRQLFPVK